MPLISSSQLIEQRETSMSSEQKRIAQRKFDNAQSKTSIDFSSSFPSCSVQLQDILKRLLASAQETFEKAIDVDEVGLSLLVFLAGVGWAKINNSPSSKQTWMAADEVIQAVQDKSGGKDLLMEFLQAKNSPLANAPTILPSLQSILSELIVAARQGSRFASQSDATIRDLILLTLAGMDQARLIPNQTGDEFIWAATLSLLKNYLSSPGPTTLKAMSGKSASESEDDDLRMDEMLEQCVKCIEPTYDLIVNGGLDGHLGALAVLVIMEAAGDAIAYKDADGILAWRASEEFERSCRADDNDVDDNDSNDDDNDNDAESVETDPKRTSM